MTWQTYRTDEKSRPGCLTCGIILIDMKHLWSFFLSSWLVLPLIGQSLSIQGNQFFMDNEPLPMWGVRLASGSQNEENTQQLISVLDDYKAHGVNAISVYVQGSSGGYSDPFLKNGKQLDAGHWDRLKRIITACQERKIVVIVGIFYQRTMATEELRQLNTKQHIYRATKTLSRQLKPFGNVIINIANEQNSAYYKRFEAFDFNDPQNIIGLCKAVKKADPNRIVGGGGYNDSLNIIIGTSDAVDVLLFDTFSKDIDRQQHSGWHYDHFREMGVPDKPFINVEIFGGWTKQFVPPGVFTEQGKALHLQEIDEAAKRPGLHVHLHSNVWMQGPSGGFPTRYHLGGNGSKDSPGIRWWFEHIHKVQVSQSDKQ